MFFRTAAVTTFLALTLAGCGGQYTTTPSAHPVRAAAAQPTRLAIAAVGNTASFTGNRSNYTIAATGSAYTVVDNTGTDGSSTFDSTVTLLRFADSHVALGSDGNAAKAYRVYQAAFDRAPDASGLGFWIATLEQGVSLQDVAAGFIQSAEFVIKFGSNPSATEFVTKLYQNVLHRAPDSGGLNYWVSVVNAGEPRQNVLANFSESPENKQQVAAAIQNGIAYSPYLFAPTSGAKISGGDTHTLAIKSDGTLWAWGTNLYGQLGDGTTTNRSSPVQIGSGFTAIAAGSMHSFALKADGSLWRWGLNWTEDLGNRVITTPTQIGSAYVAVATGYSHALALKSDGSLWAWGDNSYGQLGYGTSAMQYSPVQIGAGYMAIGAGPNQSFAIKFNGTLWAWGYNAEGQLGDGTTTNRSSPVRIGSGFSTIAIGKSTHQMALKSDGTLWAWGANSSGQLGDGTTTDRTIPVQVSGSGYISAATYAGSSFAVKSDGTLWAWGNNSMGQLGIGSSNPWMQATPVNIGSGYAAVTTGSLHTQAIKTDGTVWGWGQNGEGLIGDGTGTNRMSPVQITLATQSSTASPYAGNWSGSYSGSDSGTCSAVISSAGDISGSCSGRLAGSFTIAGNVNSQGVTNFYVTSGGPNSVSYTGQFASTSLVNGYWYNPPAGMSGTWSLSKN